MPDVLTKEQRSYNMSRIRSKDTGAELRLRSMLRERGLRNYRIYYDLPGKPDIVFTKMKLVIFVDGCFWHKCPIDFVMPATRTEFWMKKIESNIRRDKETDEMLRKEGWSVLRFWEHQIRKEPEKVIAVIKKHLTIC